MSKRPKISVAVITYNQQDYIRQTLDSILMQQGDFDLELVIGEDCSPDNTYAICQEYAEQNPKIVKLLPNTHNLGIMANYARVLMACTGEFIADIAGDDYYIDDHALEKQLNYLLQHPEVGVMGANGYNYYIEREEKIPNLNVLGDTDESKKFYFSQTYKGGVYITPVGLMLRREILKYIDFEEILRRQLPVEDYVLQAIWSQYTHFACLPDLLVTYRVYKESASYISYNHPNFIKYNRGLVETRRYLNELFPQDACFTEKQLQEQLFYKEFLYYVYWRRYSDAKTLLRQYQFLSDEECWKKASRIARFGILFYCFSLYKQYVFGKEIKKLM